MRCIDTSNELIKIVHATSNRYSNSEITVTYLPATGSWHWEIEFTVRLQFDGEERNEKAALVKAKKQIDKLLGDIV